MDTVDHVEALVTILDDMGIQVLEYAPEGDDLRLSPISLDEKVSEAAATVLTTVVAELSRPTSDPLRAYLREMGTRDLLTKNQEVALAEQIEAGIRQQTEAIAACPASIAEGLRLAGRIQAGALALADVVAGVAGLDAGSVEFQELIAQSLLARP